MLFDSDAADESQSIKYAGDDLDYNFFVQASK
jgi:hypothetical protein